MTSRSAKKSSLIKKVATFRVRNTASQFLIACLLLQTLAPLASASPAVARRGGSSNELLSSRVVAAARGLAAGAGTFAAGLFAFVNAALTPQENWNVVLTPVTTEFHDHTGLDYHQPSKKLIVSANSPAGDPHSFELIAGDGAHSAFSNVAGLQGEVLVATARDDAQGVSFGGFPAGTLLTSTGVAGVVARVSANGATVQNPWVILPEETGHITGLHVDRTGIFGGDLLATTAGGGVWRVNSAGVPTRLATLGTRLAGVSVVPADPERYGPWAGKVIVGAKEQASVYAVDPQGQAEALQVGINPLDLDIVPAHENFYALDSASRKLLGATEGAFAGIIGDVLVTQGSPGVISRVRWDGTQFSVTTLAEAGEFKQAAFSPSGAGNIPTVKQVYDKLAVVRHAPHLNSGRVEGTLWQLTGENLELNGTDTITSDLLVPGTPTITAVESSVYGGTVEGTEGTQPSGYTLNISGRARLRHVVTRTDPIELNNVPLPPTPAGTRDLELRRAGEGIGDPASLRNLSVSGNAGSVVVPPGTYGKFTVGGRNVLVFGVENSPEPTVYNLEELALTGGTELRLVGRVTLRVRNKVSLVGSTVGASDDPKRLLLEVADGVVGDALKISGNAVLYGIVRAPQGDITIEGNGRLRGTVACDYLFVNGNGVLQITENDTPPPPVNRPPTADAGPVHTITLPTDTAALEGTASDDGLPNGSTLGVAWTKVSGPGPVAFADAGSAATSATFAEPGDYVLKLTASDGQLSSSDTTTITVIPRNQPPTVDAGQEQTIELPAPAELRGTVADDALPRGSTVTSTWSVVSGPGTVAFADLHAAATTATFTAPGTYTLRLSADDTEFTVSDDVVVVVLKNDPPVVNAGADQEIVLPDTTTLSGTASDDGFPSGSTLEVSWSQISGPAAVILNDAFAARTPATFTAPGTYVLRLTASDSQLSASDEVTVVVKPQPFTSRTYTLDADFNEGSVVSLTKGVGNQLQLDDTTQSFDFIWVAVSSKGTIVKINTKTGAVIGEYRSAPDGQSKDPSRTTVDQNGNVWATNRAGNSVLHIGLVENGQCVDRNNNGVIDTSAGFGDIRSWPNTNGANTNGGVTLAQDECIIHYTKVNSFGTRHVSITKDNDLWVSGTNGQRFDLVDGKTGLIKRSEPSVGFGGYGGLIDKNGVIWSARPLLRWDTSKPLTGTNALNGMAFTLRGGRATWDRAGKSSTQPSPSESVWVEDSTPAGAVLAGDGEGWNWTSANPTPFSGALAHQSNINGGTHQHYFHGAGDMLTVGAGDSLFSYVYLDPANPPSEVMLQWNNGNWEHRAYWGQNVIPFGVNGTESRRHMGPLPPVGQWVRLEVPASQVGLEGGGANWRGYNHDSYGLCIDSKGNVWNTSADSKIRKFAPDGTLIGTFSQGTSWAQGCVVDRNDDVWVAHSLDRNTVGHLKNDGTYVGNVAVGEGPSGVAVDGAGKIWATNHDSRTVSRIDPNLGPLGPDGVTRVGAVDLTTRNLGGTLYNYSDMTGSTLSGAPGTGTWSTVFDSKQAGAVWGRLGWTAQVCGDASLTVSVASSENGTTFGVPVTIANGEDPFVADGRYLKVNVSFKRASSGESPVLYDLSVGTRGYQLPVQPNTAPTAFAGADQTMTLPEAAKLSGAACDDGFPRGNAFALSWSKVSGPGEVAFSRQNSAVTDATFTLPGDYVLRLTASDGEHSVSDDLSVTALPANMAPIVNAGPDQTITLPNTATLSGTVSDDGLPAAGTLSTFWSQLGGPAVVTFNQPASPVTGAVFPVPGTYTLRLSGNDSHRVGADDVVVTVNASPALVGATLALAPANAGPYVTGTMQPLSATLKNSAGNPLASYGVEFEVTGPNASAGSAVTNASGVATFNYSGTNPGTDTVRAVVRNTGSDVNSNAVSMEWTLTAVSPAAVQGWIGGPLNNSTITSAVPITVGAGVTLAQWTVAYWPAANPAAVTTLATGTQGGPGATLATLDPTTLANGNYVIRLTAADSAGQELVSQVTVTVAGENKPGRMSFTVTDLSVPVAGLPITIKRKYDSLERNVSGDFGHGWSLEMAGPRLEVSPDHDVTITEPGTGRRVTFNFTPKSFGFPFSFLNQPTYTPEPGVYGKLTSDGCGTLIRTGGGVQCFLSADPTYRPTVYAYTDLAGRVYTMTAAGKMQSIKDLNGNVLTFTASGITSSGGGLNVPFVRDAQGRITQITDPEGKAYRYNYDAAGDLSAVELPGISTPASYTYNAGHFFLSAKDPRGNTEQTATYYPDGRLASTTDVNANTTRYEYELAQGITRQINPDGGVEVVQHDASGLVLEQTDPLGQTTRYTYDANRNKLTQTDALGQTTRFTYDGSGNLTSVVYPQGRTIRGTYNQHGQPLTDVDGLGNTRTIVYDATFSPVAIKDGAGTLTGFTYDGVGNPTTHTDGDGRVTRYTYDAYGNVLTETDPLNRTTTRTYDGMGRLVTVTDPRGNVTRNAYDSLGRLLTTTDALGRSTAYEYDANGNRTAQVDAAGRRVAYDYDGANRLTRVNYPDGTFTTYTYNYRDQKLTETNEAGRTTRYEYDLAGRHVKTIHPDDAEVVTAYDALGRVTSTTDERGNKTLYEYDPTCGCSDRVTKITDALGRVTRYEFDAAGRRVAFTDASNVTTRYKYDARHRLVETTFADGTTVKRSYDGSNNPLTATDQSGRTTRFGYDGANDLVSVTDALNQTTAYAYDATHNLLTQTDANNRTTSFQYDALNRRIKRVLPLGMSELYTYDQVGNLVTRTDFQGRQTTYNYDALNRPVSKVPAAALAEPTVAYTYTPTGERATMTDASGTTSYTYDARDRLTAKRTPQGALNYTYDSADNVLTVRSSNAGGLSVDYAYDALNRLETVTDNRLAAGVTSYAYDAVGNLTSVTLPNGVRSDYAYNSLNRLSNLAATRGGGTLASYAYTHAPTGQRLSVTEHTGRTVNFAYDVINRLVNETVTGAPDLAQNGDVSYTLDPVGNRLGRNSTLAGVPTTTDAYDANNRLTSDSYDANGNTRAAGGRTYAYDFEDRLKSVDGGAVRIVYDGDGNRVAKTVGGVTTRYLVDTNSPTGYAQVVEEVVGGQTVRAYTYGHDLVSQNRLVGGNWTPSFYGYDGQGSVRFLTNVSGAVTDTYDYDAFGNVVARTGTTANDYLYRGEQFDSDLGAYFLRARYYDQRRGRFLSSDEFAGFADDPLSLHKYLYASADPVNNSDPSGYMTLGDYAKIAAVVVNVLRVVLPSIAKAIICIMLSAASELTDNRALIVVASVAEFFFCGRARRPGRGMGGGGGGGMGGGGGRGGGAGGAGGGAGGGGGRGGGGGGGRGGGGAGGGGGRPGGGPPCTGPTCGRPGVCFLAGTPVQTAEGPRPIEEIKEGDSVLSWNEQSGQVEYQRVKQTFVRHTEALVMVTIEGEEGEPLGTTEEHPFYIRRARDNLSGDEDGDGRWVPAGQLRAGDLVRRPTGQWARVLRTETRVEAATVYNFEVEKTHTYFVGTFGVLVHNSCRPGIHEGKQGKHIPGHNNFQPGKSELTHPDPQSLLDSHAGTGVRSGNKEHVDFGQNIGNYINKDGTVNVPTTRGTIHYDSSGGAHIVPAPPVAP
jgi:RHS repeat-associated protein